MNLRFHWMLPKGGEVAVETAKATAHFRTQCYDRTSPAGRPDMDGWTRFAGSAENEGIESVLISCGPYEPDTLLVACAIGRVNDKLKLIYHSVDFLQREFPDATMQRPVNGEMQHCCIMHR